MLSVVYFTSERLAMCQQCNEEQEEQQEERDYDAEVEEEIVEILEGDLEAS
jgi:hypothetical protein